MGGSLGRCGEVGQSPWEHGVIIEGHSGVEWRGCPGGWWDGTVPWEGGGVERVPWRVEG